MEQTSWRNFLARAGTESGAGDRRGHSQSARRGRGAWRPEDYVRVIYQVPMLMRGAQLRMFLEPALLESKMRRVSWLYSDAPAEKR